MKILQGTQIISRSVSTASLVGLLIASLATSACGVKKSEHKKTLDQLAVTEGELATAREQVLEKDKSIEALRGELGVTQTEGGAKLTEKEMELERTRKAKEATEAELIELKRQREASEKREAA